MSILRECAGGSVGGSGIQSVSATGCISGDGTIGSPLAISLQSGGYIYCGQNGLYVSGVPTTSVSGESCTVAYSYENMNAPVSPSGPIDASLTASIQIEVFNDQINFWANPSGTWILDKELPVGSTGVIPSVNTWLIPNSPLDPQHTYSGNAYRTGSIAVGSQYGTTATVGGGNSAPVALGNTANKTKVAVYDNGVAGSAGIGNSGTTLGIHGYSNTWSVAVYNNESWANRRFNINLSNGLITADQYPASRDDSTGTPFTNFLYTDDSGNILSAPHYFVGEINNGSSGASKTISFAKRANQKLTLTANCTLTFTAPPSAREVKIRFVQDGTGGRTVTFPGGILGPTPAISTTANSQTIISLYYDGDGVWHY